MEKNVLNISNISFVENISYLANILALGINMYMHCIYASMYDPRTCSSSRPPKRARIQSITLFNNN